MLSLVLHIGRFLEEIFQVHLLSGKLNNVIFFAFVDVSQFTDVRLYEFVGAHFRHAVSEVFKIILRCEIHMPLFVHRHYSIQITSLVSLATQL
jgi:hypothetical protein